MKNLEKMGTIGRIGVGKTTLAEAIANTSKELERGIVIVGKDNTIIAINGTEYRLKSSESKSKKSSLFGLVEMMYPPIYDYGSSNYQRQLSKDINLVKEFELIQNKKSSLSKWERDEVERIFLKKFEIVE